MNKKIKDYFRFLSVSDICGIIGIIFIFLAYEFENRFFALISVIAILLSRTLS